ncbi:MAG TPA: hypothetical protein VEZ71_29230, partial [Archangium sp.]|nr:hypothetical protein [Archangium sp.]
ITVGRQDGERFLCSRSKGASWMTADSIRRRFPVVVVTPRRPGVDGSAGFAPLQHTAPPAPSPLTRVLDGLRALLAQHRENEGTALLITSCMTALTPLERNLPDLMQAYHDMGRHWLKQGSDCTSWESCHDCRAKLEGRA